MGRAENIARHWKKNSVSGRLRIRMDDETEFDAGPGDVTWLLSGHDAWVVGIEAVVKTAKAMGLAVPQSVLTHAGKVIQQS